MFRKALLTVAAALAVMVMHSTAKADAFTLTQGQSVTFTFTDPQYAGASATATVSLVGNELRLSVTNTSTDSNVRLKGIGINATPDIVVDSFTAGGDMSKFSFSTNGGGLGNMEAIASSTGNTTLNATKSGTAVFVLDGTQPTSITIDQITVHLISLPNGRSVKLSGNPNNPVPEPMTMILFGTGLAGIAARARRRRNSKA